MRAINSIYRAIATAVCTLVLASCGVHEIPNEKPVFPERITYPVVLYLDYNTELPLYTTVEDKIPARASMAANYDVRYTIEIYEVIDTYLNTRLFYSREVMTRDDVNTLSHSRLINLPEGKFEIYVWTDYVDSGSTADKFYNTTKFDVITVQNHVGNNDFRDAFAGSLKTDVTPLTTELRVTSGRPVAKFNFITTDLDRFIDHLLEMEAEANAESNNNSNTGGGNSSAADNSNSNDLSGAESSTSAQDPTRGIKIEEYKIVFRYSQFMPNEFDIFSYIPIYALPNITFESTIKPLSLTEAELGFDYVFVNGEEFTLPISLEVYDREGKRISGINPIEVPLMRSQLTTVRDNFLTSQASGGIGINPSFNGPDHIFEVP